MEEVDAMSNESQTNDPTGGDDRWKLIRDIFVLQFKLIVDGLRDLILVPVSLIAGIVSLVKGDAGQDNDFYDLLRLGKRSERWINLFGAAGNVQQDSGVPLPGSDIDELVTKVESFLVEEYKTGGVTRQAKDRLDKAIDHLHQRVRGGDS